jgi:hypothetical protein
MRCLLGYPAAGRRFGAVSAVLLAAILASCAGNEPRSGVLSAEQIRETVTGNALTRCGTRLLGQWRYTARHGRDRSLEAVVLAGARREDAAGVWRVTEDGLYCRTWNNDWAGGREGCFSVTRNGDALTIDHVSGAAGEAASYTYSLGEACP